MKLFSIVVGLLATLVLSAENLLTRKVLDQHPEMPPGIVLSKGDAGPSFKLSGGYREITYRIELSPNDKEILLSMTVRTEKCVPGTEGWRNARLDLFFLNRQGKQVGGWLNTFQFTGTVPSTFCERIYKVPGDATVLVVKPANYGKSGILFLENIVLTSLRPGENADLPPPDGQKEAALFSLDDAERSSTATREKISLNGLWRFRIVAENEKITGVPGKNSGWGFFKVPGCFPEFKGMARGPGANNQILYLPIREKKANMGKLREGFYRRTVTVPTSWRNRKINLNVDMLQTVGTFYVDGKTAGKLVFPGGTLNLTDFLVPGKTHELAVFVSAKQTALTSFAGETRMYQSFRDLDHRGLCGDVELESVPKTSEISDVHIITQVQKKKIAFDVGFVRAPVGKHRLHVEIFDGEKMVKQFDSPLLESVQNRVAFSADWIAPKLWDTDTPQNLYTARVRAQSPSGTVLDQFYPRSSDSGSFPSGDANSC